MHQNNSNKLTFLKSLSILFVIVTINSSVLQAQQFKIDGGAISTTMSDSRSVNFFDINNDGFQEIYISNGLSGGQKDLLYSNIAGGIMIPTGNMEIVNAVNPSDGASFADYNNDGHIDGIVTSWYGEEDLLYLNNGSGKLNYNANAGIASGSFAETAAFGDYNNDGWLDIYVTHSGGDKINFLYKNLKNGKFERITNHVLINDAKPSRGAIWGDFNDDGHLDLFVTNESNNKNDIFYGSGDGNYTKDSGSSIASASRGSMTGSWGDIDNDGDLDLFVGNSGFFAGQSNQLYLNNGNGFSEVSNDPVTADNKCSFGSAFADFDNDGDLDLAVANGFCNFGMANDLFENQGNGSFVKVSHLLVDNNNICSYGLAWGDINNDGFLELMIANCKNSNSDSEHPNTLLLNQGNSNNWLQVCLRGTESNTNAIGAKIRILATINGQKVWQRRDVSSQSGYAGQNSMVSHFGLVDATTVDSMIIFWPSGKSEQFADLEVNQILKITEGIVSSVNEITNSNQLSFSMYPNPIQSPDSSIHLKIQSQKNIRNAEILIFDSLGSVLKNKMVDINEGETNVFLSVSDTNITSGIYQVSLRVNKQSISQKLIVLAR